MESFVIKTPSSSANIGPGFDVIGLALTVYLELHVTIDRSKTASAEPLNCRITYEGQGEDDISLDPQVNLITRVALYVLRCHDQRAFPVETHVHIKNPIPLGRGLGSSGAAVVAGVLLGKEVGGLHHLDNDRLFDYCLMIERHPDNVGAALFGGFVGTYLMTLQPEDVARIEIPLSEVLPSPAGGVDTGKKPPEPPVGIGHHIKFPWAKEIKAVAIIPDFVVPTHEARAVLPDKYPRQDVVSLCARGGSCWKSVRAKTDAVSTDFQPAANSPASRRPWHVAPRPGAHPSRHAGQGASAVPPDAHPRPVAGGRVHVAQDAARVPGRVPVRCRPDHSGAGHEQL